MSAKTLPICLSLFVAAMAGCGGSQEKLPQLVPVHGKVTLDGQPLANANISFLPPTGPSSAALTNDAGVYVLMNKSGAPGAVAGLHAVIITTDLLGARTKEAEKVPAKYNSASTLTASVSESSAEHNFDLTSK